MILVQRTVRIVGSGGSDEQGAVTPRNELGLQIRIGLFQGLGPSHAQAFHQTILRRLKAALDPSLGLRRVRPDPDDAQLRQGPSYLRSRQRFAFAPRQSLAVPGDLGRGLKRAALVGVEVE